MRDSNIFNPFRTSQLPHPASFLEILHRKLDMMTSSNGNIFRVTGHLWGEFTGQWRGALMFSLICVEINGWENNREAGDLRRHRAHYDVMVMIDHNLTKGPEKKNRFILVRRGYTYVSPQVWLIFGYVQPGRCWHYIISKVLHPSVALWLTCIQLHESCGIGRKIYFDENIRNLTDLAHCRWLIWRRSSR